MAARAALLGSLALLAGTAAAARPLLPAPGFATSCRDAIAVAERTYAIPHGLLRAIGLQESGRRDPVTGTVEPWPWTVDVDGHGTLFDTAEEAVAFVTEAQKRGAASIDVGCMQINLQSHPAAFRSLEEAFDPVANTQYGARFLSTLFAETRDWVMSTGFYHSRTPALAIPYQVAVTARLAGGPLPVLARAPVPGPPLSGPPVPRPPSPLATAWAATLQAGPAPNAAAVAAFPAWAAAPFPGRRSGSVAARAPDPAAGFLTSSR